MSWSESRDLTSGLVWEPMRTIAPFVNRLIVNVNVWLGKERLEAIGKTKFFRGVFGVLGAAGTP